MAITQADGEDPIGYISIVPRSDGTGGFTSRLADTRIYRSFPDLCCDIRIALAGRAAEELVFGKEHISGGSGGSSRSDLAVVSRGLLDAFAREMCIRDRYSSGQSGSVATSLTMTRLFKNAALPHKPHFEVIGLGLTAETH